MKIHPHLTVLLLPIHILWMVLVYNTVLEWWLLIAIVLLWIVIGGIGLELGFHRTLAHKQFLVSNLTEKIMTTLACMTMNGSPTFWKAMHVGYHHHYSDTHRDFHTPKYRGRFFSYIGYINLLYKVKYVGCRDMIDDHYYSFLNKFYILLVWIPVIIALLISTKLALVLVSAMVIGYHQTAIINSFCHCTNLGYRSFDTKDESRNIPWLTWATFGQSLHNNHHAQPKRANNAVSSSELDLGFLLSKLIGLKVND